MRSWRSLKKGDHLLFIAEHRDISCSCTVTDVSDTRVIARTSSGAGFWIDDDSRYLFKKEGGFE